MFCSNCGNQMPDDAEVCSNCGKRLEGARVYTRMGITTGLLAAGLYFSGLFNSTIMLLIAGYILLFEKNQWVKSSAVKAVVILAGCSIITYGFGAFTGIFDIVEDFLRFGKVYPDFWVLDNISALIGSIVSLAKTLLYLILGFMAFGNKTIKIGLIDNLVTKYMKAE